MQSTEFTTINGVKYPVFDLTQKYQGRDEERNQALAYKQKKCLSETNESGLKSGDIIHIISGYHSDMIYKIEIIGFDQDGDIYLLWDCYWFPVKSKRIVENKL